MTHSYPNHRCRQVHDCAGLCKGDDMCGRYATTQTRRRSIRRSRSTWPTRSSSSRPTTTWRRPSWRPIVIGRPADEPQAPPQRELLTARWGLIPSWAKDPSIGSRMINARSETVAEKPAFKKAFARRRALVPADGYYEWYAGEPREGEKKPTKQPFYITPKDGSVLAMAGLYEFWKDREAGEWVVSYTILDHDRRGRARARARPHADVPRARRLRRLARPRAARPPTSCSGCCSRRRRGGWTPSRCRPRSTTSATTDPS